MIWRGFCGCHYVPNNRHSCEASILAIFGGVGGGEEPGAATTDVSLNRIVERRDKVIKVLCRMNREATEKEDTVLDQLLFQPLPLLGYPLNHFRRCDKW